MTFSAFLLYAFSAFVNAKNMDAYKITLEVNILRQIPDKNICYYLKIYIRIC